jgi:superfamily II DNA or RNA helicase
MDLRSLRTSIDPAIWKRGLTYWQEGRVSKLQEKKAGLWTAKVRGSGGRYDLTIILDGSHVDEWDCDCPYDGPVCKHAVAVLLEIAQRLSLTPETAGPEPRPVATPSAELQARRLEQARQILQRPSLVPAPEPPAAEPADPLPDPGATPESFLAAYEQLPVACQRLVAIAALAWEALPPQQLVDIYRNSALPDPAAQPQVAVQRLQNAVLALSDRGYFTLAQNKVHLSQAWKNAWSHRHIDGNADARTLAKAIQRVLPRYWYDTGRPDRLIRDLRLLLFFESPEAFIQLYSTSVQYGYGGLNRHQLLSYWVADPFDRAGLDALPPAIRTFLLGEKLAALRNDLLDPTGYADYAVGLLPGIAEPARERLVQLLAELQLLRLDAARLSAIAPFLDPARALACTATYHLLNGDFAAAAMIFDDALVQHRRALRSPQSLLPGLFAVWHALARLAPAQSAAWPKLDGYLTRLAKNEPFALRIAAFLRAAAYLLTGDRPAARAALRVQHPVSALDRVFFYLAAQWVDDKEIARDVLAADEKIWLAHGYTWPAREAADLRCRLHNVVRPEAPTVSGLIPRHEPWEDALIALLRLGREADRTQAHEGQTRIVWLVDFQRMEVLPREQSFGKKGWTAGRNIAYERLSRGDLPGMTAQDKAIADGLSRYAMSIDSNYRLDFGEKDALRALAGHPHLYLLKSPDVAVQLTIDEPALLCETTPQGFRLSFSVEFDKPGFKVVKESPTRYKLVEVTEEHVRIARVFDGPAVVVPAEQRDRLQEALGGLTRLVTVQSSIDPEIGLLPAIEADARPNVHILPTGELYQVELFVKPLGTNPPYFKPGDGPAVVVGLREGERFRAVRDLAAEAQNAEQLASQLEKLRQLRPEEGIWTLSGTAECLELLLELHPHVEAGAVVLEWPKGERLRVAGVMRPDALRVRVGAAGAWFDVQGELALDEKRVLDMRQLLAYADRPFVEIEPGRFLALTDELRRRLHAAQALLTGHGDGQRLHPLAAAAFEQAMQGLPQLEVDAAFGANLQRLKGAFSQQFDLPDGFVARLRPYQFAGYEWLRRCAEAGFGACLADDMGLGKTIQALALLVARAALGPALVVAPASVCRNWESEARKFAPALRPLLFGAGDRAAMIAEAGPGDLVIVTYDLMAREGEQFTAKQFATAILDEAQSIKNRLTKRSATAMALQARFRIIMTGTPVENHLGELWNLFHFANPGLLGTIEHFTETYSIPIEKYGDRQRREELRRLLQPFILRRRKDEVLADLPAKTEITLHVEPSPEELAFYEALRRKAVETLEGQDTANAGERHLRILAELMRLRRAACHPALVEAGSGFASSAKLRQFEELVDELLDNGHRALVFSQFVDHLKLLEKVLKKKKIAYQYLDGQTALPTRQKRIQAFQGGDGHIFLISLKAGGVGLNLTAADYVIHMDPWWNPAVEDQATDRAHRIGQEKPVTVYRVVTAGTIEEKILKLHEHKRDLADALLAGTDRSARLTADELLELLRPER